MGETLRDLFDALDNLGESSLADHVFRIDGNGLQSLDLALEMLRDAIVEPPHNLIPIMPYCDGSFACAVCESDFENFDQYEDILDLTLVGLVRWHLGLVPEDKQAEELDTSTLGFLESMKSEIASRSVQRSRILETSRKYYNKYVVKGWTPRAGELRPIQLACQNVIIGLASLRHDLIFDGLRVEGYTTCEVPHLAAGEADRAMASILLCDAFKSGGTMEIRFGQPRHEEAVPASLVRFSRIRGIEIGKEDRCAISPSEARDLFFAVTPMEGELGFRSFDAIDRGIISPERLCYTFMAGIWNDLESAFILATSARATSIFCGGADERNRIACSAEKETSRSALLLGLLYDRLSMSPASNETIEKLEVDEDDGFSIDWEIDEAWAYVTFEMLSGIELPWLTKESADVLCTKKTEKLRVVPRGHAPLFSLDWLEHLAAIDDGAITALLLPLDASVPRVKGVMVLRCPMTIAELDEVVMSKMQSLKVGRK